MFFCFASEYFPFLFFSYSIKTSFQISTQFTNISVSGPHGPVSPAGPHQFSSFSKNFILLIPKDFHIFSASISLGESLSPEKTETAILFLSSPNHFFEVKNSKLNSIACFFQ